MARVWTEGAEKGHTAQIERLKLVGRGKADPTSLDFGKVVAGMAADKSVILRIPVADSQEEVSVEALTPMSSSLKWTLGEVESVSQRTFLNGGVRPLPNAELKVAFHFAPETPGVELRQTVAFAVSGRKEPISISVLGSSVHPDFDVDSNSVSFGNVSSEGARRRVRC